MASPNWKNGFETEQLKSFEDQNHNVISPICPKTLSNIDNISVFNTNKFQNNNENINIIDLSPIASSY